MLDGWDMEKGGELWLISRWFPMLYVGLGSEMQMCQETGER
jgi:hypothetical protein